MNVAPYKGQELRENSGLKVLVAQGYYDFATPFFADEYELSRTGIPQDRIQYHYYEAGHMMYNRDEERSEENTSEHQSLRRRSYAVYGLKKKKYSKIINKQNHDKYKQKIT